MTHRYAELMFSPNVRQLQETDGSRRSYARFEAPDFPARSQLTEQEVEFIAARDSFYLSTVSETGWPYVQHRGGEAGFLKVIDEHTIGFADHVGNRQFISFGNMVGDDKVSLFLMDYPNRQRLKILGHARLVDLTTNPFVIEGQVEANAKTAKRGTAITIEAFDWNCPKYITPRFTQAELEPLSLRLKALEAENAELRRQLEGERQ